MLFKQHVFPRFVIPGGQFRPVFMLLLVSGLFSIGSLPVDVSLHCVTRWMTLRPATTQLLKTAAVVSVSLL